MDGDGSTGKVWLVGAGPGDPELLTRKAWRLLQQADVVLHDSLIEPALLDVISPAAERIHVGKRASRHTLPQTQINALMVRLARAGRQVLRIKGGDPFIFGRGGEEIAELARAGIPFEVVPGITAAQGCGAYAGIPLTHRDYAGSVTFVTAHLNEGKLELDWPALVRPRQTLVFYMARITLPTICARLVEHGLPGHWPAALVADGATPRQQVITAGLDQLPARVAAAGITGACLLIVGEVVRLRERLSWYLVENEKGRRSAGP